MTALLMIIALCAVGCGTAATEGNITATEAPTPTTAPLTEAPTPTTAEPTEAPTPTTEPEPTEVPSLPSEWSVIYENKFDFPVYDAAFRTADFGLTVGYSGEIHCSTDAGTEWPRVSNQSACLYGLDFVDENVMYACGNEGKITKSTDGGQHFAVVGVFTKEAPVRGVELDFVDENNGMIAASLRMGITSDGGENWKEFDISGRKACIMMASPEELYYIGGDFCLYKSLDGGESWECIPLNLPLGEDYLCGEQKIAIHKDCDEAFTVYCTQKSSRKLKAFSTIDNCQSWTEIPMPDIEFPAKLHLNKAGNVLSMSSTATLKVLTK